MDTDGDKRGYLDFFLLRGCVQLYGLGRMMEGNHCWKRVSQYSVGMLRIPDFSLDESQSICKKKKNWREKDKIKRNFIKKQSTSYYEWVMGRGLNSGRGLGRSSLLS